ncbi:ABC transporter ATP-binding protein, partial [Candidatus Bathyarchaeota archaeon]
MDRGETLGLVGESGSGKSTLGLSILRLIPPPGKIIDGKIVFDGMDITSMPEDEIIKIRGKRISMVFQDPMTSLDPLMKIGDHLIETIMVHENVSREEAEKRAKELLESVGILPDRFNDYPHQFSGGMRQRVMIAL